MFRIKNMLGCGTIFLMFLATVWLWTLWPMSLDRALMLTILAVLAQVRWYQEDKSPLGKVG